MDQDKINVLNGLISKTNAVGVVPTVEFIADSLEWSYPEMVDSVTTGMIQARIKEYNDGR